MSRHAKTLLWLALLALLAAALGGWWWWRGVQVEATTLQRAPLVRTLQFSARVATLSRVEIGSTVTGRVAQVLVDEGAQVRQGQLLVQLESDEQRAALAQAVAAEQQSQVAEEMNRAVVSIRDVTENTVQQTVDSATTSNELATLAGELTRAIGQLKL